MTLYTDRDSRLYHCLFAGLFSLFCALPMSSAAGSMEQNTVKTSVARHGTPKYADHFLHFDYVNPNAPKGGVLKQAGFGTFNSLNPFAIKGTAASGLNRTYDTLMFQSADEAFSLYPLIADSIDIKKDHVTFTLNPKAVFQDGHSINAEDVKFTFDTLVEKGHPFYRNYYADIALAEVLNKKTVRFHFKQSTNPELPYIIAALPVLPKHAWETLDFNSTSLTPVIGSGPYKISAVDGGRSIRYKRVKDYWAKDLAVNIGRYNFNSIIYDYYRDSHIALQAFKAGEQNYRYEHVSKNWATAYNIPAVEEGKLILNQIENKSPAPIQGILFNLRRPIFQDSRVREALSYAFDFEWLNRNQFYDSYVRANSYFNNSGMEATGIPQGDELALLAPWREQLPPALFTEPFSQPTTDGSGNIRKQLHKALTLLKQAGWHVDDNQLINEQGQPFEVEILVAQPSLERILLPFKKNLAQMGITLSIRVVDVSQYIERLRNFDFDMTTAVYGQSSSPGNEQLDFWGSTAANTPNSRNYAGIQSPVVDAMIQHVIEADTQQELTSAVQALDRVLLWGYYMIPQYYAPYDRIIHSYHLIKPTSKELLYHNDIESWWYDSNAVAIPTTLDSSVDKSDTSKPIPLYFFIAFVLGIIGIWRYQHKLKSSRSN